jgi:hypothetical protein
LNRKIEAGDFSTRRTREWRHDQNEDQQHDDQRSDGSDIRQPPISATPRNQDDARRSHTEQHQQQTQDSIAPFTKRHTQWSVVSGQWSVKAKTVRLLFLTDH